MNDQKKYEIYKDMYYKNAHNCSADTEKSTEVEETEDQKLQNEKTVNVDHITEIKSYYCCFCHKFYTFNNQLHRHLHNKCSKTDQLTKLRTLLMMKMSSLMMKIVHTNKTSSYIQFIVMNSQTEKYDFKN